MRVAVFGCRCCTILALGLAATATGEPVRAGRDPRLREGQPQPRRGRSAQPRHGQPGLRPVVDGGSKSKDWEINDPTTGKGYESAVAYGIAKRLGFTEERRSRGRQCRS